MNSTPLWRVYAEMPVPTVRPHDHHARLQHALSTDSRVISAETAICGTPHHHYVAATAVIAAPDARTAGLLASEALQRACAVARLPTGPLRAVTTELLGGQSPSAP